MSIHKELSCYLQNHDVIFIDIIDIIIRYCQSPFKANIALEFQRRSLTQYFPNVEVKLSIYIKTMFDQQMRCFTLLVSVQI